MSSRITHHAIRNTQYVSRLMFHVLPFGFAQGKLITFLVYPLLFILIFGCASTKQKENIENVRRISGE